MTPTIGNGSGGTNTARGLAIDAVTGDAEVTLRGIDIGALTGTAAAENAIVIGSGWDAGLSSASPITNTATGGCAAVGLGYTATTGLGFDGSNVDLCRGSSPMIRTASTVVSIATAGVTFKPRHIGSVDTAMGDVTTGTCTSETVTGTNTIGELTATCSVAGQTIIATFGTDFDAAPHCVIGPADQDMVIAQSYVSASAVGSFTITAPVAVATPQVLKYICIQPS